jgi:hypothetical protein
MTSIFTKIATTIAASFVFSVITFMGVHAQAATTPVAPPPSVSTNMANNVCRGVLSTDGIAPSQDVTIASCQENGDQSFSFIVRRIINIFSVVVGAVSVIMIIIGGFRYIISGGDSSGVSGAKNTILYAIVGLVIVLFAQVIIRFVLTNISPTSL